MILSRGQKIFVGVLLLLVVVSVVAVVAGWWLIRKPLPQLEGEIAIDGLSAPVHVYRDDYGVPHISAATELDLMLAAGFVQAQDRLWQMDLLRRVAEGRLSEILGARALDADKMLRTVGMMRVARRIADSLDRESRELLEAYTAGVNQYIEKNLHNYPIEFVLLGYEPYPWKLEHSIGISRVMAWQLNMGWMVDVNYQRILDSVGPAMVNDILPGYPSDAPVIVRKDAAELRAEHVEPTFHDVRLTSLQQNQLDRFVGDHWFVRRLLGTEGSAIGSNAWVVGGNRSKSGKPILANDPHLAHGVPSTWYEMHLQGGRFNVTGFALPGTPLVVLGNNDSIAWGFTNVMCDDADFFEETIQDKQYLDRGQWRPLQIVVETIKVKDSADVVFEIRFTHRGPLISSVLTPPLAQKAISMLWLGSQSSFEIRAIKNLNLARNWDEFRAACSEFKVPGQNVVYADVAGNIGYQCMSGIPIRRSGDGLLVHNGASGNFDWTGMVPFESLPFDFNPSRGYLASANNKTANDLSFFIGNYWEHPSRIQRIEELLSGKEKFSVEDFKQFQLDWYSWHARDVVPYVLHALEVDSSLTSVSNVVSPDRYQESYLILRHWDFQMDPLSRGAAIFNHFFRHLLYLLYRDEMGQDAFASFIKLANIPTRVTSQLLDKPDSRWWDDRTTDAVEGRDDILRRCFRETVDEMVERYGGEPSGWMWGDMHTVAFEHLIGRQAPFDYVFNVGPLSMGGNTTTINNTEYFYGDSTFRVLLGPSMRRIVDLADITNPQTVLTLGQSGQAHSAHYDDQVALWAAGKYKTVSMVPSEFQRSGKRLTLIPEKPE